MLQLALERGNVTLCSVCMHVLVDNNMQPTSSVESGVNYCTLKQQMYNTRYHFAIYAFEASESLSTTVLSHLLDRQESWRSISRGDKGQILFSDVWEPKIP